MQPAVFLDRDNTLIANEGDLGDPEQVRLIDGVALGLRRLREAGYRLVVVTNQGGVARGKYTENEVDAVHLRIAFLVDESAACEHLIDRFYYCPYHPEAAVEEYRRDHPWRKPHPGMMIQAARDLGLDLHRSWLIGDQVRDIQAGRSAGCRTILVSADQHEIDEAKPTESVESFDEAVELILREGLAGGAAASRQGFHRGLEPNGEMSSYDERAGGAADPVSSSAALTELANIRRAVHDLSEEIRADRLGRSEFTPLRLAAGVAQLLVLLLALLGLMQLHQTELFFKWLSGAGLMQLLTIAILLADQRS